MNDRQIRAIAAALLGAADIIGLYLFYSNPENKNIAVPSVIDETIQMIEDKIEYVL